VPKKYTKQTRRFDPVSEPTSSGGGVEASLRVLTGFQRFAWDIAGVACLAFAIITLLAFFGLSGGVVMTSWGESAPLAGWEACSGLSQFTWGQSC
jgi:hypothetical protein